MAYKHNHCVIPTVALVKPRETLPESERSPLGGARQRSFSFTVSAPRSGSNQEVEVREKLTGSFFTPSNKEISCQSEVNHPSSQMPFFLASRGSSVHMKTKAGEVNERLLT